MRALFDTHILLWTVDDNSKLSPSARSMILNPELEPWFSTASIWEIAIKFARRKPDFAHAPHTIHATLLDRGWQELVIKAAHVFATVGLSRLHDDPFDRLLLAQAAAEGMEFVTADRTLASYAGAIRLV